jgi:UDP-N-acetylglucosamine 1-carboxyvinyltransferase
VPVKTYDVSGPACLTGDVPISGAKNSALTLMAASLLIPGRVTLDRVPQITDVELMSHVLRHLGATVELKGNRMTIDASGDLSEETPYELVSKMRASIQVLGPLLARMGRARVSMPGGDAIGPRPIDLHLEALERMSAKFAPGHGYWEGVTDGLKGARVLLEFPSVGATENLLTAAALAEGTTVIDNAAREPEISDLADFLNAAGACVLGAGTTTITVEGVHALTDVHHEIVPDRVEAGTFAIAAAATGGDVRLYDLRPDHLELVLQKLEGVGAQVRRGDRSVRVSMVGRARAIDLVTLPYPGFPTDLQPLMMVLFARANGSSILTENVHEARFLFVDELNRMGSQIRVEGRHAVIRGVDRLSGAPVRAPDIRAGAALVLGGLCAQGRTQVYDSGHIERGYERFDAKLRALGADVTVVAR